MASSSWCQRCSSRNIFWCCDSRTERITFLTSNRIYTVQVNYIGYQTQVVSNVRVTIGLTTIQNFELAVAAAEGETVEVTAEKPLIEVTATNVQRTMDSEAVENYAVRNVTSMVAASRCG